MRLGDCNCTFWLCFNWLLLKFGPSGPRETVKQLSRVTKVVLGSFSHQPSVLTRWTFFLIPWLTLTHKHTRTHSLSVSPVAGCLPGLQLGSLWYFGSDKSSSHCTPPRCLPGSAAAITRQLVLPNRFKLLWKTASACNAPGVLLPANGKAGYRKNIAVEQWRL